MARRQTERPKNQRPYQAEGQTADAKRHGQRPDTVPASKRHAVDRYGVAVQMTQDAREKTERQSDNGTPFDDRPGGTPPWPSIFDQRNVRLLLCV